MASVTYFTMAGVPGEYFLCDKQRCTISKDSCAVQFRRFKGNLASKCNGCEIGAEHAGQKIVITLPEKLCGRCGGTDKRIIGKRVCVSCYNRERELKLGRNAKGRFPVHAKAMRIVHAVAVGIGMLHLEAANAAEALAVILRKNPGAQVIPARQSPVKIQQDLPVAFSLPEFFQPQVTTRRQRHVTASFTQWELPFSW